MTPTPPKKTPKCGGEMADDKKLGSYTEITLKKEGQFLGDRMQVFYCVNYGYIELYCLLKSPPNSSLTVPEKSLYS
jgi:hypothetical protein